MAMSSSARCMRWTDFPFSKRDFISICWHEGVDFNYRMMQSRVGNPVSSCSIDALEPGGRKESRSASQESAGLRLSIQIRPSVRPPNAYDCCHQAQAGVKTNSFRRRYLVLPLISQELQGRDWRACVDVRLSVA